MHLGSYHAPDPNHRTFDPQEDAAYDAYKTYENAYEDRYSVTIPNGNMAGLETFFGALSTEDQALVTWLHAPGTIMLNQWKALTHVQREQWEMYCWRKPSRTVTNRLGHVGRLISHRKRISRARTRRHVLIHPQTASTPSTTRGAVSRRCKHKSLTRLTDFLCTFCTVFSGPRVLVNCCRKCNRRQYHRLVRRPHSSVGACYRVFPCSYHPTRAFIWRVHAS